MGSGFTEFPANRHPPRSAVGVPVLSPVSGLVAQPRPLSGLPDVALGVPPPP